MKNELDQLEESVGSQLRRAMPEVSLPVEAVERMRPRMSHPTVVPLPVKPRLTSSWWKRAMVAALVVGLTGTTLLTLSPAGRALAKEAAAKFTSVWKGTVADGPGEVLWTKPSKQDPQKALPGKTVATVAEAAAQVGFQPVELTVKEAILNNVEMVITDTADKEYESRWVTLTYTVKDRSYKVVTMVHYRKWNGEWMPIPQPATVGYALSDQSARNVRTVEAGGTEGLAFEVLEAKVGNTEYWRTDVTWNPEGNQRIARLHGTDPVLTVEVAKTAR